MIDFRKELEKFDFMAVDADFAGYKNEAVQGYRSFQFNAQAHREGTEQYQHST
jgi:hypothetical protein